MVSSFLGTMKFDSWQADCSVAWLDEVLALFTISLQHCQQLKDKVSVFAQYKDFKVEPSSEPDSPKDVIKNEII